ncbi:MAG: AraC family transcriptional regulator ligand-binding domain-containing protein [Anaerolineaceae bacterium]|nr:AraC family transcriptional regulator ligand-binding domain-containing protein [Anaerolineaceae bacterium]MCB9097945.1 AraC family transcriptional regulator ligand-binding domain-containing protein [Anaerolineales bacterium]
MKEFHSQKYNLEKGWPVLLKNLGLSVQDVLRHAQLPLDLLLRKTPAVTAAEYYRFWDGLAHASKHEPALALRLAQIISANAVAPAMIAFLSSSNLNIALKRTAHYKPIVAPVRMDIEQNNRQTILTFAGVPQNGSLPPLFVAFELVFWVQMARMATREQLNPETVDVSLDLPELAVYEAFLATRIRRDEVNRLTFSAVDAQKPFLTANHAMWAILEPAFDQRMEDLTQEASFRDRVRACLLEILASGHYSMTYIASKLAMSNRTLQRRLREEGTTFQQVLDELREELARHYLATTDYTSAEISFLLGYEEPNSFFRAFQAWTGQTPEIVRANRLSP